MKMHAGVYANKLGFFVVKPCFALVTKIADVSVGLWWKMDLLEWLCPSLKGSATQSIFHHFPTDTESTMMERTCE